MQLQEVRKIIQELQPNEPSRSWWGTSKASPSMFVKIAGETFADPASAVPDKFGKLQVRLDYKNSSPRLKVVSVLLNIPPPFESDLVRCFPPSPPPAPF
jgi:hypothetical protein